MRLILIDNHTGYIFADTADINGAALSLPLNVEEASKATAEALDASINAQRRTYTLHASNPRSTATGYHIYRADTAGSEAVPVIHDGQDKDEIQRVMNRCEYVGFVACFDATD